VTNPAVLILRPDRKKILLESLEKKRRAMQQGKAGETK